MANKSIQLEEKFNKSVERISKILDTIERTHGQAEKKRNQIISKGWNPDYDRFCKQGNTEEEQNECYWLICEYDDKLESIKNNRVKLEEARRVSENWKEKLEKQLEIERTIEYDMPEIFIQCREMLAEEWTSYDICYREKMREHKRTLEYLTFRKMYSWSHESDYDKSDEALRAKNTKLAEMWIVNLYNDVKAITGTVTDWKNIHFHGKALNGIVIGENGKARVEVIEAGGYNIQRLHLRKLVHEVK